MDWFQLTAIVWLLEAHNRRFSWFRHLTLKAEVNSCEMNCKESVSYLCCAAASCASWKNKVDSVLFSSEFGHPHSNILLKDNFVHFSEVSGFVVLVLLVILNKLCAITWSYVFFFKCFSLLNFRVKLYFIIFWNIWMQCGLFRLRMIQ